MSVRDFSGPPKTKERAFVKRGLDGQDDSIDLLDSYFREMQKTTVETAYGPDDFLSFACCVHYFGVIMIETLPAVSPESNQDGATDEDAEGEPEEDTQPVSRATSPPSSVVDNSSDHGSPRIAVNSSSENGAAEPIASTSCMSPHTRSRQEMIVKWQEAFNSDLEEAGDELFIPPDEDPNAPFFSRTREAVEPLPHYLVPDPSRGLSSSPMTLDNPDDFVNYPDEGQMYNDPLTSPVIQQDPAKFYTVTNLDTPFRSQSIDPNLGREYLEPAQYDSPAPVLKESTDPETKALIYNAAIQFQDELRSNRIRAYEAKKARKTFQQLTPVPSQSAESKTIPIGLIYLSTSQNFNDPLHMGECSMGFYIAPAFRQKQSVVSAVNEVAKIAFNDRECHRLQSIVVDNDDKLPTLELLASAGFRNEGVRRRAFYSNAAVEWKDVTYFAMLATEWVHDNNNKNPQAHIRPKSLWDDLITRHQRECDDLVRLEEKQRRRLKRAASTETVREPPRGEPTGPIGTAATSRGSISLYSQRALQKKRRLVMPEGSIYSNPSESSTSEYLSVQSQSSTQEKQPVASTSRNPFSQSVQRSESSFATSSLHSRKLSDSPPSIASSFSDISGTSDWEMLDDESIDRDA